MGNELDLENNLDKRLEQRMNSRNRSFYYLAGSSPDHRGRMKSFLLGPYGDYDQANRVAESKKLTSFTIENLETSDLGRAGQILKARRLHGGSSMADIFERVKHRNVGQPENTI
jgi:hypothetical protein